ncbi:MAG: tetratricopeptide repeat protein [Nitrospira sp.]|nr:tetratricopeptide repeat protein [Nitrospira sp.]
MLFRIAGLFSILLIILFLLVDRMSSGAQVTLWETYQSEGHQAILEQRVADAEQLLLAAAKHIEIINPEDPRLASTLNDLGVLYSMQNRDSEAEAFFHRSLTINENIFGRHHPSIILVLQNLSVIYASQDKFFEAHQAARESLAISLQLFGPHHPRTGSTCRTIATVYELHGSYEEAEQFVERALTIFDNTLGERHPETEQSLEMMIRLMWATHRERDAQRFETRLNALRQGSDSE